MPICLWYLSWSKLEVIMDTTPDLVGLGLVEVVAVKHAGVLIALGPRAPSNRRWVDAAASHGVVVARHRTHENDARVARATASGISSEIIRKCDIPSAPACSRAPADHFA